MKTINEIFIKYAAVCCVSQCALKCSETLIA
jgi:hypothetical protein